MQRWVRKLHTIAPAKARAASAQWRAVRSGANRRGARKTQLAPAVMPNIATEIATKAKWYHIVTLKIRVRRTSYISVASATRNRPAYAERAGAGAGSIAGSRSAEDTPRGPVSPHFGPGARARRRPG